MDRGGSEVTQARAEAAVRAAEKSFGEAHVGAMLACFSADCRVRFAEQPEIRGTAALEAFLHPSPTG